MTTQVLLGYLYYKQNTSTLRFNQTGQKRKGCFVTSNSFLGVVMLQFKHACVCLRMRRAFLTSCNILLPGFGVTLQTLRVPLVATEQLRHYPKILRCT